MKMLKQKIENPKLQSKMTVLKPGEPSKIDGQPYESYHNRNKSGITFRMMNLKLRLETTNFN
jgi:hypothetical protein